MESTSVKTLLVLFSLLFIGSGCSTGHCRRDGSMVPDKVDAKPPTGYKQEDLGSIQVAKADGSLQCEMKSGFSLEDMAKRDLSSATILSSHKQHDGLVRIQSCGVETGMMNVYEIKHQDLSLAQKSGFTLIKK